MSEELRVRGPTRALAGDVTVPGDKSIGHRAVLLGALTSGRVRVRGLSGGQDNLRTVLALRALGAGFTGDTDVIIDGVGIAGLRAPARDLDCGNSGTSIRLLAGLLAGRSFRARIVGDEYLHARPMRRVAEPLRRMGGRIDGAAGAKAGEIYPPLEVGGVAAPLHGIDYASPVASAQVKSAVLLAALGAEGATTVREPARSRDHSERMLSYLGAPLRADPDRPHVTLDPAGWDRRLAARDLDVPGDLSSAAFVLGAATLVPGSRVVVRGVGVNPTRTGFLDALAKMGAEVALLDRREQAGEPVADLECRAATLRGIEIAGELTVRAIDELPLLCVLAAHAAGTTIVRDAAELRVKESDRIQATVALLRAFGARVEERDDGLEIEGGAPLHAATVDSRGDHRIAMAGVVCALSVAGETRVLDVENIATSFPGFAPLLASLGAAL